MLSCEGMLLGHQLLCPECVLECFGVSFGERAGGKLVAGWVVARGLGEFWVGPEFRAGGDI